MRNQKRMYTAVPTLRKWAGFLACLAAAVSPAIGQTIFKTSEAPVIDAEIDAIWDKVEAWDLLVRDEEFEDDDLSAQAKMLWDDTALYYLVIVTDDALSDDGDENQIWTDDSVEIYIDADNSKGTSYDANDAQISLRRTMRTDILGVNNAAYADKITWMAAETDTGYIIEMQLLLDGFAQVPAEGVQIGIDFQINDDDDGGGGDGWIKLFDTTGSGWQRSELFGTATFSEDAPEIVYPIYMAGNAPTIDGSTDPVWDAIDGWDLPIRADEFDANDLSANAKVLWDENNLYYFVTIMDDELSDDSGENDAWMDDSVEIYIDGGNEKATSYDSNDAQVTMRRTMRGGVLGGSVSNYDGKITFATMEITGGYVVEMALSLDGFAQPAEAGTRIGIEFQINDDDDGDGLDGYLRLVQTGPAFRDPSIFGTAELMEDVIGDVDGPSLTASANATVRADGPTGSPWFHNAQGPGDFASFAISSFTVTPDLLGEEAIEGIDEFSINYTQANASFTSDGEVQVFISFDTTVGAGDYASLTHDGTAAGIDDSQFSDDPTTQGLGSFTFSETASGDMDVYMLDVSGVEDALVAAINAGDAFSIILVAPNGETAVTYAGIENSTYPESIFLAITPGEGGGGEPEDTDLIITGLMDGPLPGGLPKAIELYALADIADLSIYGIGSANNGGGSDGEELTLSGSASAGDYIYIASEELEFTNVFGMAPDFVSDAAAVNGDDAVELFLNGTVVDLFGDINTDGTGEPWEHLDSWAYRKNETMEDPAFNIDDWTFGGVDALDDLDAAGVANAVPFGTYSPVPVVEDPLPWDDMEAGDTGYSTWFGSFMYGGNDWLHHAELGWIYVGAIEDTDNMWFYSLYRGSWLWSSEELFTISYDSNTGTYIIYFILEDIGAYVYDYSTGMWTLNP